MLDSALVIVSVFVITLASCATMCTNLSPRMLTDYMIVSLGSSPPGKALIVYNVPTILTCVLLVVVDKMRYNCFCLLCRLFFSIFFFLFLIFSVISLIPFVFSLKSNSPFFFFFFSASNSQSFFLPSFLPSFLPYFPSFFLSLFFIVVFLYHHHHLK